MSESPTSRISQDLLDKVIRDRNLYGFNVKEIGKTGSSLQILDKPETKGIVRNAEIPASSMAVWQFLHTHAAAILPTETVKKLFGLWQKPQVAPILERRGKDRVYYGENSATAYSELVGYDTQQLTEMWQLTEEVYPFYFQNTFLAEPRWLECASYHLAMDILKEVQSLDPEHEVQGLIERYWDEFTRLNQDKIDRQDLLRAKELRRQDMDMDKSFSASVSMIETGHEISQKLVEIYQKIEKSDKELFWKDKSAKNAILLLTHLYQTSTQQSILWWMGVSHGHLHLFNTVSRIPAANSHGSDISPLITSIIDFDASRISVDKLSQNDELYALVNGDEVKSRVMNDELNQNLRLTLLFYLPLEYWDEDIVSYVEKIDSPLKNDLLYLVSLRASKDIDSVEKYTWFADFLYKFEQNAATDNYPAFIHVLSMLQERPYVVTTEEKQFGAAAKYFQGNDLNSLNLDRLSQDERVLLLSAIYFNRIKSYGFEAGINQDEMKFVISQLKTEGKAGNHSEKLIRLILNDYYETSSSEFFKKAIEEQGDELASLRELVTFVFSRDTTNYSNKAIQRELMRKLVLSNSEELAISLIDFSSMKMNEALLTFNNMVSAIEKWSELSKKSGNAKKLKEVLELNAKESLGWKFKFLQRIKKIKKRFNS